MDKFEIVSGNQIENKISKERNAGISIYKEDEGIYKVHLNIFPTVTFFMKKNHSNGLFTIFSRKKRQNGQVLLQDPVGQGKILESLKTHMKLHFDVLNTTVFMSLYPKS